MKKLLTLLIACSITPLVAKRNSVLIINNTGELVTLRNGATQVVVPVGGNTQVPPNSDVSVSSKSGSSNIKFELDSDGNVVSPEDSHGLKFVQSGPRDFSLIKQ